MTFPFTCSACGHVNHFGWSEIGQKITCGGCEKLMTVPVPMETVGPPAPPPSAFTFRCPACQRKFKAKPELAGKKIRCNGCGAGVRVPQPDEETVAQTSRTATTRYTGNGDSNAQAKPVASSVPRVDVRAEVEEEPIHPTPLLDELGWIEKTKRPKRPESILPSRTELMEQVRQKAAEDEAALAEMKVEKAKKKRNKKKKGSSYFDAKETLQLVAGVGALVAVLAFLAWGYPGIRFPLGGLLCVIGFIVYLLGRASLRQVVAEEGVFKLLLFRFFPPYQLLYVMSHWEETKDFFAFFLAGAVIMSIGGAIIKTSDEGKRAEISDRAFQKLQKGRQEQAPPPVLKGMSRDDD